MLAIRLFIALLVALTARPYAQQAAVAFEHVNYIPMSSEQVQPDRTILVADGQISVGGNNMKLLAGTVRVDGRGRYLMPALAEMHAHIPNDTAEAERVLFMYAANGIGTIRSMLGDPSHFRLRDRVRRGELIGPAMVLSGPSFNGQTASTPAAAAARVVEQARAGYDFLKMHPGIPLNAFNSLAAAADRSGIRFAGHVPREVGLQRALQAKYWTIDHLDGYMEALAGPRAPASQNFGVNLMAQVDESRIAALAAETKAAGVSNVPTQILLENWYGPDSPEAMLKRPEMQYVGPAERSQWAAIKRDNLAEASAKDRARFIAVRRRLIKALQDAGAELLLGSDAPQVWNVPGFSIHRELASYVAAGLTPYQALLTGTRNVQAHLAELGSPFLITDGEPASLVLLEGNPLENITNTSRIAGVVVRGRWIPKTEIDRRLAGFRAK